MASKLWLAVLFFACQLACTHCSRCAKRNWWSSFDEKGVSKCEQAFQNINGFYRNDQGDPDDICRLEEANCCERTGRYGNVGSKVVYVDWWSLFDNFNVWAFCPAGYFLNGLYRSGSFYGWGLWLIEEGRCSKPSSHPDVWGECYIQDVSRSFDSRGDSNCRQDFFITGLYHGNCQHLYCIEKFRCCRMISEPRPLGSLAAVKTRMIDTTQQDITRLAHYLGYAWSYGCRADNVGEDFQRSGDTLVADTSRRCDGYKSHQRLKVKYADWSFRLKDIRFGQPLVQELTPESADGGTVVNNDDYPLRQTVSRQVEVTREVRHTTTSSWSNSHELGLQVSYTPFGVGFSTAYKFNYETSSTTQDSSANRQTNTFSVEAEKQLGPHAAANWTLLLFKTRRTVTYTATVVVDFSTELQGFLRSGEGPADPNTNYHHSHRGSQARPTFNYRFGNSEKPFYKALRQESESGSRPWLWMDMLQARSHARDLIDYMSQESHYEFTLTGQFDDVYGTHVSLRWDTITEAPGRRARRSASNLTDEHAVENAAIDHVDSKVLHTVAKEKAGDPPPVFPDSPKVVIDQGPAYNVDIPVDKIKV